MPRHKETWKRFDAYCGLDAASGTGLIDSQWSRESSPLTELSEDAELQPRENEEDILPQDAPNPICSLSSLPVQTVVTSYDPRNLGNMHFPAPRDRNANDEWTAHARTAASNASKPSDLLELETTVSQLLVP